MAVPVIESSASTAFAAATASCVITKPTGLAVGELLVAAILYADSSAGNAASAPAGWSTLDIAEIPDSFRRLTVFYIEATSTETAASNFTFTTSGSCTLGGALLRISGIASGSAFQTSEDDSYNSSSVTTISFTGTTTPSYTDSLVLMFLGAYENTGAASLSAYTSTPSKTWTEVIDISNTAGTDLVLGIASATSGSTAEITAYGATLSVGKSRHGGILAVVTAPQNAQGTNALISVSPTLFAPTASAGTIGTNAEFEVSPTINTQSGEATAPTQWTSATKNTTTWTNTNKS